MNIIIKNKEQIEGIRQSSHLASACLKFIEPYVVAGITTGELDWRIEEFIRSNNAIPACLGYVVGNNPPFPKATCISVNDVICHGIPGEYILKDGDIFNIDVTTILNGYFGDTSKMYAIGEISKDAQHLLNVTKKCMDIGIKQIRPGNRFGNIGYSIQSYAWLMGCTIVEKFTGHGTGIRFHEDPQIYFLAPKDSGPEMKPGMIFTVEPMLCLNSPDVVICEVDKWTARTIDGGLSAQYEETVLVTENGYEILTKV